MKKYVKLLFLPCLLLVGCSGQKDVSEDFQNNVYYNVEDPQKQLVFSEDTLRIDAKETVKPYMTEQEMDDMKENYSDFEALEYDNIKVLETDDHSYEVFDSESDEVVFEFEIDSDSDKLIVGDTEYLPMN